MRKFVACDSALKMGLFDGWIAGGSGRDSLDEEWEKQQAMLKLRRAPEKERGEFFSQVEKRREDASKKQNDMWGWQTKNYGEGEDPITEWRKRRESGQIPDMEDQYDEAEAKGGIPFPMASFGVGGEFGVGGKFDNGLRFDLRLPYADQGYIDDDADFMGKIGNFFSGNKKEKKKPVEKTETEVKPKPKWPWEQ